MCLAQSQQPTKLERVPPTDVCDLFQNLYYNGSKNPLGSRDSSKQGFSAPTSCLAAISSQVILSKLLLLFQALADSCKTLLIKNYFTRVL